MEGLHFSLTKGDAQGLPGKHRTESGSLSFPLSLARLADFLLRAVGLVFFKKSCPKVATVKPPSMRAVR